MAKFERRWLTVYLYAYSKGESDDDLKVSVERSSESTVVQAGPVNSSKESIRSKPVRKLGQAGVGADKEGRTTELLHSQSQEQLWSVGSTGLLIETAPQVVPPPAFTSQPMGSQLDIGLSR